MKRLILALVFWLGVTPMATAATHKPSDGYTYFNRAEADLAAHNAALWACKYLAAYPSKNATGLWSSQISRTNLENCMVVRGWRVIRVPDEEGAALLKLPKPALAEQLASWVGAEQPHGTLVRVFENEAPSSPFSSLGPLGQASWSLSVESLPGEPKGTLRPDRRTVNTLIQRPANLNKLGAIPDDTAIILMSVHGPAGLLLVRLTREGPDFETPAWEDERPDMVLFPLWGKGAQILPDGSVTKTLAFAVPPGQWRMGGFMAVNFCLGAPVTDVRAGEVVYLGAFDFNAKPFRPDLTLDSAQAFLSSAPQTFQNVRPAIWKNGSVERCQDLNIYALEFPGLPFVPSREPAMPTPPR